MQQLSYGRVVVRSYGRYDVNGFRFRSASFEAARPRAATVNSGVVTRAVDAEGREINYYGIIQNILEFSFAGDKKLEVFFFDCKWFDSIHGIRQNQFGMVEIKHSERLSGNDNFVLAHQVEQVYYLSYPCQKLDAWWVVYKVNPRERLHTPAEAAYHIENDNVDEVYQEEEIPMSFDIEPGAGLDSLVGGGDDVTVLHRRKRLPIQRKARRCTVGRRGLLDRDAHEF